MSREAIQKAIEDTIIKYEEIILGVDSLLCKECFNEFQKQWSEVINEIVHRIKFMGDKARKLAWATKNIVEDNDMIIGKKQMRCWVLKLIIFVIYKNSRLI